MINTSLRRAYSTALLGHVVTTGSRVALHLPAPMSQSSIFARLKQSDRAEVFDKVERSLLWEQMSTGKRRLIFRPTRSQELAGRDEPVTVNFRIGKEEREIELQPKVYEGPPSYQDLRVVVLTSRTAEDVQNALNVITECLRYKETRKNAREDLLPSLLRRAAATGCFQSIYFQVTASRELFEKFTNQEFYQEALRIYALRVPFLSHRSKNMIQRAYRRSTPNVSRDLAMIYAMASYAEKFGMERAPKLSVYIKRLAELEHSERLQKHVSLEDIALGIEGLRKAGVSEDDGTMKLLTAILDKRGRHRPQIETLAVELADQHDESEAPHNDDTLLDEKAKSDEIAA